jgi:hypothetical protein
MRFMQCQKEAQNTMNEISSHALEYLDNAIYNDYQFLIRHKADLTKQQIGPLQVDYLYMRSFYDDSISTNHKIAFEYYRNQARQFWLKMDKQSQGKIALVMHRAGDKTTAGAIVKSLKENAILNPTLGMYWKDNTRGFYWHQAPIETHSLLIEAFLRSCGRFIFCSANETLVIKPETCSGLGIYKGNR